MVRAHRIEKKKHPRGIKCVNCRIPLTSTCTFLSLGLKWKFLFWNICLFHSSSHALLNNFFVNNFFMTLLWHHWCLISHPYNYNLALCNFGISYYQKNRCNNSVIIPGIEESSQTDHGHGAEQTLICRSPHSTAASGGVASRHQMDVLQKHQQLPTHQNFTFQAVCSATSLTTLLKPKSRPYSSSALFCLSSFG